MPTPSGSASQPSWKTRGDDAERRAGREQVHHRRGQRDQQAAEGDHQQQAAEQDDHRDEQRQLVGQHPGEVVEDRGDAADVDGEVAACFGTTSSRSVSIRSLVALSCGAVVGRASISAILPLGDGTGGLDRREPVGLAQRVGERCTFGRSAFPFGRLRDDLERAVEAGAEPVGEQVVGLAGGRGRRVLARVGGASRSDSEGTVSTSMMTSAATASGQRWSCTIFAQRGQKPSSFG